MVMSVRADRCAGSRRCGRRSRLARRFGRSTRRALGDSGATQRASARGRARGSVRRPARVALVRAWRSARGSAAGRASGTRPPARRARRLGQQALAPALERVLPRGVDRRGPCAQRSSRCRIGAGIDVAHQLADVLDLPLAAAPCAVMPRAARSRRPAARAARLRPRARALRLERDQRLAQVLQRVHLVPCAGSSTARRRGLGGVAARRGGRRRRRAIAVVRRRETSVGGSSGSGSRRDGEPFAMIADATQRATAPCASRRRDRCRARPRQPASLPADRVTRRQLPRPRAACATAPRDRHFPAADRGARARRRRGARRCGARRRRDGRRDRGLAGGRPERHRAPAARSRPSPTTATRASASPSTSGSGAATRAPPISRDDVDSRHRRQGAGDRALHRRGSGRGPRRSRPRLARDMARPRPLSPVGPVRRRRRSRSAARPRPRRSPSIRGITNTEGATVARSESEFVYANSLGFAGGYRSSRHHIDCSVIGEDGAGDAARLLVHGGARAGGPRAPPRRSAASPASARCAGSARASSARSNARCCSRRPRPPT